MAIEGLSRPEPTEYAGFFAPYLARVPEVDALPALEGQLQDVLPLLGSISEERAGFRYAPGKWSIRQVVGHLSDAERVFGYRMLRFSRGDQTPLPGFEENLFVDRGTSELRTLEDLTAEFTHLRQANLHMIRGLTPEMLTLQGTASDHPISVRALAFVMVGHVRHHLLVLKERYL